MMKTTIRLATTLALPLVLGGCVSATEYAAKNAGFSYVGQTVFESLFGGKEVASIFERDVDAGGKEKYEYRLLATNKTSTMQKELQEAGDAGFRMIGLTVGKTLVGGNELVSILRRPLQP